MNTVLINIIAATLVISSLSLVGALTFFVKEKILYKISFYLVAFSAGALIGGSFFHLLPEVTEISNQMNIYFYLVLGILIFFVLERFLKWHHCHEEGACEVHTFTYMSLFGDGMHNFLDGLVIASAFMVSTEIGVVTAVAVAAHELPQEMGDFGVLIHGGFSKLKALLWNFIASVTAVAGGLIGYLLLGGIENVSLFLLPFAAGGFIYIAMSDLIPEIHKEQDLKKSTLSFFVFITGLAFMLALKIFFGE